MKQIEDFWALLDDVRYKQGWQLKVGVDDTRAYLQWNFMGPCCVTGEVKLQACRKWQLSPHMTDGEVVQTAFAAALHAEEHECREFFTYQGKRIFGPHISLPALLAAADQIEGRT